MFLFNVVPDLPLHACTAFYFVYNLFAVCSYFGVEESPITQALPAVVESFSVNGELSQIYRVTNTGLLNRSSKHACSAEKSITGVSNSNMHKPD